MRNDLKCCGEKNAVVSIIVPVYNVEQYIDKCVQSLVDQTYTDLEILLIDDGSTDSSGERCCFWAKKDPRIKCFHKKNEGQGPTRDYGINLSRGEFLSFVDPDDWVAIDFIESMLEALQDADFVFCDYYLAKDKKTLSGRRYFWTNQAVSIIQCPLLLNTMGASLCNKLFRRDFWIQHAPPQPAHAYEDTACMPVLCVQATRIVQLRRLLYYYRIDRMDSTTNQSPKISDMFQSIAFVINNFEAFDLREKFGFYLEKYCATAFNIPISRMKRNKIEVNSVLENFYKLFPIACNFDRIPAMILGSAHAKYALSKASFLRTEFERVSWEQNWQEKFNKSPVQFLLIDLMGKELPEPVCVAEALNKRNIPYILGLSGNWSLGYGIYDADIPFESPEVIEKHNRFATSCKETLQKMCPQIKWLDDTKFNFTDCEFPLGCFPWFKNDYFYFFIAEQIWQIVKAKFGEVQIDI